jgi:hypothetical protein
MPCARLEIFAHSFERSTKSDGRQCIRLGIEGKEEGAIADLDRAKVLPAVCSVQTVVCYI